MTYEQEKEKYHLGEAGKREKVMQERITDLERQLAEAKSTDGPCFYCGIITDSIAANPSRWAIWFPHCGEPGVSKAHHVECVLDRIAEREMLKQQLTTAQQELAKAQEVIRVCINTVAIEQLKEQLAKVTQERDELRELIAVGWQ